MTTNKEHSLAISKILDCYLNTQVNDLFDLAENMKALNNFQVKINELQDIKNANQIEQNIRQSIPEVYDIVVHIEPFGTHPEDVFGVEEKTHRNN